MSLLVRIICIALVCFAIGVSVCAKASPDKGNSAFLELKKRIEARRFSYNEDEVQPLLSQALGMIETFPDSWYPRYYAGLIDIQLGNIYRAHDRKRAYDAYVEALNYMLFAFERAPVAETAIVLADTYGKLASLKTVKMFYYGYQSKHYLIEAFRMNEKSPKSHLIAGIELMWAPAVFGGSKKRARQALEKALALETFWRETDPLIVRWATRPEIFAHLAQLEILSEQPQQAQAYADRALRHVPEYGFVKRDILPQLEAPAFKHLSW